MDDRDLEARLRTHLHRRFDLAQPPTQLVASLERAVAVPTRRLSVIDHRGVRLGWSMVAAVAVIGLIAIAGLRFGGFIGPAATNPTPTPTHGAALPRPFIVLPGSRTASADDATQAELALTGRLLSLGFANFTSLADEGVEFELPAGGPSDAVVRAVLAANGDLAFVPLPPELAEGVGVPEVGGSLPPGLPVLFGWEGIEAINPDPDGRGLLVELTPAASRTFAEYTTANVGGMMAVVIDGRVAMLPAINEPITSGEVTLSPASDLDVDVARAILTSSRLPETWRDPVVPEVLPRDSIVAGILQSQPSASVRSAELDANPDGAGWRAVWIVVLDGEFRECSPGPSGEPACLTASSLEVVVDAATGEPISSRSLAEPE